MAELVKAHPKKFLLFIVGLILGVSAIIASGLMPRTFTIADGGQVSGDTVAVSDPAPVTPTYPPLDTAAYDAKVLALANLPKASIRNASSTASTTASSTPRVPVLWPVTDAPYPANGGALLPWKRIVAYYGNLYSKQMGVLGEYPEDQMLNMLRNTAADWQAADTSTQVVPALDYIAVAAQAGPQKDGTYRLRMPDDQVDKILEMAQKVNGIVFLDIQVGLSSVEAEVPLLENYLKMPQVHLSLDPEFAMHGKERPGTVIGTMDAKDINWAANYLANLVKENNLPPKILVIHRFTEDMVTRYKQITPLPEVQIVMDMDGFGFPAKKINTYKQVIYPEPVQFTGFKLFYKNDIKGELGHLMTPSEVLRLSPQPSYIQYQ